jgi:nucleotide-binding universal stress UspA family protein
MSAATHILLTTDFSEASEEAVAKAGEMARVTGARLTVLNVHHHAPAAPEAVVPAEKQVTPADLEAEARQRLDHLRHSSSDR